ncbi:hypothetical protein BN946_scf184775.g15 [Trametes cinnabarina]|uniref:Uncharacterized protein n=1 Tax=Pycnoporus cinnabarinus TaxID=5643 RepID=A0A060SSK5_PYCCI|nr:hypothetical protein BN946_scf184775.g15 [Trametes cinnabarina]
MVVSSQQDVVELLAETSPLPTDHSRSSTHFDSAYSHTSTDISFGSTDSEANRSMTTTSRAYKRVQLSTNRPSTLSERQPSSRVFSLPEATPKFRMKNILGKKTTRVVSMPSVKSRDPSDVLDVSTNAGDPFGSENEEHTRVRVKSQATDVPYTSSAPSSPDSIVIIANNSNQLSSAFLRPRLEDSSSESEDEGLGLAWAESPPRPIPALHGPLSLPYARCPSGAEGTIIEEPESLPRVIWGLDAEASKNSRQANVVPPRSVPKKLASPADPHNTRPPIHNSSEKPPVPQALVNTKAQTRNHTVPYLQGSTSVSLPPPPDFILKHSEPIDLGRLSETRLESVNRSGPVTHSNPPAWQTPFQQQLPTPELVHDLSPDLRAMLFAQERLRAQGLPSTSLGSSSLNRLLQPAPADSSLALLESIKSSRSPIVLDDFAPPYGSYAQGLSSQMSALGMAQKHRQPQLNAFLPTPPSSSSPLWSSNFSPYQGVLLSPELLAAAGLSQLGQNYVSSQAYLSGLDNGLYGRGPTANGMADYLASSRKIHPNGLAPAAQINGNPSRLPPRLAADYARRRLDHHSADHQPVASGNLPKPPPNTPYSASRTGAVKDRHLRTEVANAIGPLSPTSPREPLGLSPYSRSIPLNKLMQRRLSIVPEEEQPVSDGRMAPEASRARVGAGRAESGAAGLHLYLSASGRSKASAPSLNLPSETHGLQHGMAATEAPVGQCKDIAANIKILGIPPRTPGPVGRGKAQPVREAQRRQGGANLISEDDGGQRHASGRGRGQKRGGSGRKARGGRFGTSNTVHGAERVDGGMMVKS